MPQTCATPIAAIDVSRLVGRYRQGRLPTGVDRVSLAYVAHFRDQSLAMLRWRWFSGLFSPKWSAALFDLLLDWRQDAQSQRTLNRILWLGALSTISQTHRRGLWLFHTGHQGLEQPWFKQGLRWHSFQPVFFLHDLIPITHPEFCRTQEPEKHRARLRHMLAWGHGLIVNSEYTANELRAYAHQAQLRTPPVLVAPLAPALDFTHGPHAPNEKTTSPVPPAALGGAAEHAADLAQQEPYFLAIGTIEPRKNIPLLVTVWRELLASHGPQAPRLILVGQMGWEDPKLAVQLADAPAWQGRLIWLAECDDASLQLLLRNTRALLFPSFVEGFGLPIVEALSQGVPVIASDLPALREAAGDVPLYLSPQDVQAWRNAVLNFSDPADGKRTAQLERLKRYQAHTWSSHFERVDAFLAQLRGNRSA